MRKDKKQEKEDQSTGEQLVGVLMELSRPSAFARLMSSASELLKRQALEKSIRRVVLVVAVVVLAFVVVGRGVSIDFDLNIKPPSVEASQND
ncbi:hypothetical protein JYT97_00050 [Haliea sp. AH-315-K21]|uniref:Uncharacterized protein n=1 Tax=SAR86 cluster bacterium TaxID=2030880 RepID=A0A2A5CFF0_9GAMM|nr:hypothetical protein [Haliea sp. AH-315-K21]MBN4075857.1 hypothetical protein [Gammaproteobacteria bacterium AH-315-E17]PCJ42096.1 MAG: hypothetical protein COA71_05755 [SAR86 cluster bacterium]